MAATDVITRACALDHQAHAAAPLGLHCSHHVRARAQAASEHDGRRTHAHSAPLRAHASPRYDRSRTMQGLGCSRSIRFLGFMGACLLELAGCATQATAARTHARYDDSAVYD